MEKLVENCLGNGIHKLLAQYHTLLIDVFFKQSGHLINTSPQFSSHKSRQKGSKIIWL